MRSKTDVELSGRTAHAAPQARQYRAKRDLPQGGLRPTEDVEEIEITGMSPKATFECGQCFRWDADESGADSCSYSGVAFGKTARVYERDGKVLLEASPGDFEAVWRDYFDLDEDYAAIREKVGIDGHMRRAAEFGAGIRILRQDRWEALCSFIISQCNNIPRIKKIISALCANFGEEIAAGVYSFPSAERLAALTEPDLAPLRAGYRAKYIIGAARAFAEGRELDTAEKLLELEGVGKKVASCVALFGLHDLDAFPIDTWVKKALAKRFSPDFDPKIFSPYAGVAQQYMFYYERSGVLEND
ncbi:MAG: DNA-3-methyladenine glycosylase 2 family protein [Oscillospiraceae bacterium]|jgi:N-glycosylase/DNA lyase|nr:DNA-3-methyladenine glycosylase 2 family protein [Oscillospiraceae bacterium]